MSDYFEKLKEEIISSTSQKDELKLKIKDYVFNLIYSELYYKLTCLKIIDFDFEKENFMKHMEFIYDKLREYVNELYEQNAERYYRKIVCRNYWHCSRMIEYDVNTFLKKKCLEILPEEKHSKAVGCTKYDVLFSYTHYLHENTK